MTDTDKLAAERVMKARAELIMAHRFYGVLVSNVDPIPSRDIPTMATDSVRHYYNPEFVHKLTQDELLTVQMHESEHDARKHGARRKGRDPQEWNIACDFSINIDLIDMGRKFPTWFKPYVDARYRGWSAEDIYRARELDRQRQQQQQQGDEPEQGDEPGNEPDEQGTEGEQTPDASHETDQPDGDQPTEMGTGEPDGPAGQESDGEAGNGIPEPVSCGDPGGMGEVLDPAPDAGNGDVEQKWERIVRQAASIAKAVGDLPGHVSRDIEQANQPKQDWREVFRQWIDGGCRQTTTWNRPNRRFIGQGIILPGSQRDGINKVVMLIDTSGSMDNIALRCIAEETQGALDDGAIDELIVVYGDTQVTRTDTYREGDNIEFDPRGGGGTDMQPLFKWTADHHDDASLIICFTDGWIGDPGPQPASPVLWAFTGYPDHVRNHIANAPWGEPGIDVGSH